MVTKKNKVGRPSGGGTGQGRKTASSPAVCRALVPGDGLSLRKKLMKDLKSAERRFEKAQQEWMRHQQVDMPEFRRWHHLELGPLEQEIHRYQSELHLYDTFLAGLEQEQYLQARGIPALLRELVAYAEANHDGNESHRLDGEWSPAYLMSCGFTLWQEPRKREFDRRQERLRQQQRQKQDKAGEKRSPHLEGSILDFLMGMLEEEERGFEGADPDDLLDEDFQSPPTRSREGTREQEFRSIYRKLCRALHPDVAGEATPERHQLWLDVQDAYEARDFERMEALHAAWEMKGDPQGRASTCARILAATRECMMGLRSLQRDLRTAKKHPGWHFAALAGAERTRRARQMMEEMKQEIGELKWNVDRERREFLHLMKMARPPNKRKAAKPRSAAADGDLGPTLF